MMTNDQRPPTVDDRLCPVCGCRSSIIGYSPLLTSAKRVDMAVVGLLFTLEFVTAEDPEDALDMIEAASAEEDTLMGNA